MKKKKTKKILLNRNILLLFGLPECRLCDNNQQIHFDMFFQERIKSGKFFFKFYTVNVVSMFEISV